MGRSRQLASRGNNDSLILDASAASTDVGEKLLLDASAAATDVGFFLTLEDATTDNIPVTSDGLQNYSGNATITGDVGIGDTSPTKPLTLGTTTPVMLLDDQNTRTLEIRGPSSVHSATVLTTSNHDLLFGTNDTEAARVDTSGTLLVGRTTDGDGTAGGMIRGTGFLQTTRDGNLAADFNRLSSDGDIVRFQRASSPVGTVSVANSGGNFLFKSVGDAYLTTSTSDGSDDHFAALDGGNGAGSTARGAFVGAYGNEHGSYGGNILLMTGVSGVTRFLTGSNADERMRVGSAGDVSIGTSVSPPVGLTITADEDYHGVNLTRLADSGNPSDNEELGSYAWNSNAEASNSLQTAEARIVARAAEAHSGSAAGTDMEFYVKPTGTGPGSYPTERVRITAAGVFTANNVDHTGNFAVISTGANGARGFAVHSSGTTVIQNDDSLDTGPALLIGRVNHDDGDQIVRFGKNGTSDVGNITESGGTVSYNAFMGSHITQSVPSDTLEGTVLESTGELLDSTDEDYKGYVEQKRLTKCKVSDTEDSPNVFGVWQVEAKTGVQFASSLGAYFVRVDSSETVSLGDLLSSKGNGTAKVQSDDIIRSKTIGKVTSLTKKTTYSDGSYLLPCVLYCG
tara:strand:- start:1713 stop:3590 length:1878 start_codon:yes stop_codon:yes gene_type:complete